MVSPSSSPGYVLIVDDDENARDILVEVLQDAGFAVQSAANGVAALRQIRGGSAPGLVVLDLSMPLMDGWQFLQELADHPATAAVPIVLLTAHEPDQLRTRPPSVAACVTKPFRLDELIDTVRQHCAPLA